MSESKTTNVNMFGWGSFMPALTLIFITLKLTGIIDWSWWWVLAPIWVPITVIGIIAIGIVCFALTASFIADIAAKQQMEMRKGVFRKKVAELKDKGNQE